MLPNNEKQNGKFDEELILRQLISSNTISYAKFMRFGYPKRISLQTMLNECKLVEEKINIPCVDRLNFIFKVLLCIGFRFEDFKMGNDAIFFRSNKFHLIEKFFLEVAETKITECTLSTADSLTPQQKRKPK